ncbi:DUF1349 domain-containing protein [uncultured Cedecea sp.]|uniref:DUF1349 domain-containing protein n=1 Tax=uncultured Cedecea sp. TaxID=988762 RepID=UPI00261E6AD6|nr:DUF1349 domain-containing protein [uncultured Cedecea sp.]
MHGFVPEVFLASKGSEWSVDEQQQILTGIAHPVSDIYIDPSCNQPDSAAAPRHDAATLMTSAPVGDFQLSSTVTVYFKETFDAGVLLLRASEQVWAKLCFEYSPDGEAMVVSVVNKGKTSDDANAFVVAGSRVDLRISRKENVYSFHAAVESNRWIFIRAFSFDESAHETTGSMTLGFMAQSPNGSGCKVEFGNISLTNTTLAQLRDGN